MQNVTDSNQSKYKVAIWNYFFCGGSGRIYISIQILSEGFMQNISSGNIFCSNDIKSTNLRVFKIGVHDGVT